MAKLWQILFDSKVKHLSFGYVFPICDGKFPRFAFDKMDKVCTFASVMSKQSIREEIEDFKKRGGEFCFTFGDVKLPVVYHEAIGTVGVRMPAHEVFIPVDYNLDMGDNLDRLMDKLLEQYPQLTE